MRFPTRRNRKPNPNKTPSPLKRSPKNFSKDQKAPSTDEPSAYQLRNVTIPSRPAVTATTVAITTDHQVMSEEVSHNPKFNHDAVDVSNAMLGTVVVWPAALFVAGSFRHDDHATETGLLSGEAIAATAWCSPGGDQKSVLAARAGSIYRRSCAHGRFTQLKRRLRFFLRVKPCLHRMVRGIGHRNRVSRPLHHDRRIRGLTAGVSVTSPFSAMEALPHRMAWLGSTACGWLNAAVTSNDPPPRCRYPCKNLRAQTKIPSLIRDPGFLLRSNPTRLAS